MNTTNCYTYQNEYSYQVEVYTNAPHLAKKQASQLLNQYAHDNEYDNDPTFWEPSHLRLVKSERNVIAFPSGVVGA